MNNNNIRQLVPIFIFSALSFIHAFATNRIVAKSGGTYTTIQAGVNAAIAGDTVTVKAGIYNEMVTVSKSGTETQYITIRGESGAVIDGTGLTFPTTSSPCGLVYIENQSYIIFQGFEIKNAVMNSTKVFQAGIFVLGACKGIQIRNNKVSNIVNSLKNSGCHGIGVYGTSTTALKDIVIDGNEVFNCQTGWSESMVLNGNVDGFTVSNNIVHDNNNIGIDFIGHEGTCSIDSLDRARNGNCTDNHVYNITSKGNAAYGNDQSADGIYVDGGLNIIIERNKIDKCDIGIELASEWPGKNTEGVNVRNNFVSRSVQGNLMTGGYDSKRGNAVNCSFINNTTYCGTGGEIILQYNCKGITIINNIFVGLSSASDVYIQEWGSNNLDINISNNIYWGGSTSTPGAFGDALARYVNPQMMNTYLDMHISGTSPAVDSGIQCEFGMYDIDKQTRILGSAVDVGADEYIKTTNTGIAQISTKKGIKVYPNPVNDNLTIEETSESSNFNYLIIYDIKGKELIEQHINSSITHINMSSLDFGVYFIKIVNDKSVEVLKIIKK